MRDAELCVAERGYDKMMEDKMTKQRGELLQHSDTEERRGRSRGLNVPVGYMGEGLQRE